MQSDQKEISKVIDAHPGLQYYPALKCLAGIIYADDDDTYSILIDLNSNSGKFPRVIETGERIPKTMDRHKFPDTDVCCLTTEARAQILMKTKARSLSEFLENVVIPYFQNNSYYEINNKYLHGEYSHGWYGILEGYQDILKVKDPWVIEQVLLNRLKKRKKRKGGNTCYCGSGKPLRHCDGHRSALHHFNMIDVSVIQKDVERISKELRAFEESQKRKDST